MRFTYRSNEVKCEAIKEQLKHLIPTQDDERIENYLKLAEEIIQCDKD